MDEVFVNMLTYRTTNDDIRVQMEVRIDGGFLWLLVKVVILVTIVLSAKCYVFVMDK